MAVTLTQFAQDISRRQRACTSPSKMAFYNHHYAQTGEVVMPMPEHYFAGVTSAPQRPYGHSYPSAPYGNQDQTYHISMPFSPNSAYQESPHAYCESPTQHEYQRPPPVPEKEPLYSTYSNSGSPTRSEYSDHSATPFSSTIEPDPLPPHSNPQVLGQTQSQAYVDSKPVPALRLGKDEAWNSQTGLAEFRLLREAAHAPSIISTKPLIHITKTSNGQQIGSIRFHHVTSNNIELTVGNQRTSISHSGMLHNRWSLRPTSIPNSADKWYWKKDRHAGGAVLEDAKRGGHLIARLQGDLLTFEWPRLSQETYDEVVITALALAEAARRQKRKSDIVDLGDAIGDFTSSDGSHSGRGAGSWG